MPGMDVRWISAGTVETRRSDELEALLRRPDGFVWVDLPECDDDDARALAEAFGFHPLAVAACRQRVHVPKVHAYTDHLFVVLHGPLLGGDGVVHLLEIDQFVGHRYLVTVHGPLGEAVALGDALAETRAVARRIEQGRFHPGSAMELSYAIVSGLARRMEGLVTTLAHHLAALERRVMRGDPADPQRLVEEMFRLRHQLLTVQTMASQARDLYVRMSSLARALPPTAPPFLDDLVDQFSGVRSLCDGEREFLQGVIDLYQTRTSTELNLFAKKLSSVGAILVTATLVAGIYGMNFRYMPELDWRFGYPMALALMALVSAVLAWYFRRRHWL